MDGLLIVCGKKYEVKIKINLDIIFYFDFEKGVVYLKDVCLFSWEVLLEKY